MRQERQRIKAERNTEQERLVTVLLRFREFYGHSQSKVHADHGALESIV